MTCKSILALGRKSIGASLLISLGVYGLLKTDYSYLSMILFAFGLYVICSMKLNLFTGKCGFVIEKKNIWEVLGILAVNLVSGYLIGMAFHGMLGAEAESVVMGWEVSMGYFLRSVMCGVIMFIAVKLYNEGTPVGIFFGIPLFIMCGFQHSIANVIIMGTAMTFNWAIVVCVIGNWIGSLVMWGIDHEW